MRRYYLSPAGLEFIPALFSTAPCSNYIRFEGRIMLWASGEIEAVLVGSLTLEGSASESHPRKRNENY